MGELLLVTRLQCKCASVGNAKMTAAWAAIRLFRLHFNSEQVWLERDALSVVSDLQTCESLISLSVFLEDVRWMLKLCNV